MPRLRPIWVISGWTLLLFLGASLGAGIFLIYAGSLTGQTTRPPEVRVLIDPGHGGIDSGCHWGEVYEKDLTLEMALLLKNRLEEAQVPGLLTRSTDRDLDPLEPTTRGRHLRDLQARAALARQRPANLMVSLHVNAAASENLSGAMVFYQPERPESRRLAALILEQLREVVPGNQNGILSADFYLLRTVPYTTVLVEAGFLTGSADRPILTSRFGQERIAEAIASGIMAYIRGGVTPAVEDRSALAPTLQWPGYNRLGPDLHACSS